MTHKIWSAFQPTNQSTELFEDDRKFFFYLFIKLKSIVNGNISALTPESNFHGTSFDW